ncbi:MAG: hypothetical protein V3U96_02905 [Paracoccaceae bacterium]
MDNDFVMVLGVLVGALTAPALVSSFSAGRSPRAAIIAFVTGGALVSWAVYNQPNSYSVDGFPDLFVSVVKQLFL